MSLCRNINLTNNDHHKSVIDEELAASVDIITMPHYWIQPTTSNLTMQSCLIKLFDNLTNLLLVLIKNAPLHFNGLCHLCVEGNRSFPTGTMYFKWCFAVMKTFNLDFEIEFWYKMAHASLLSYLIARYTNIKRPVTEEIIFFISINPLVMCVICHMWHVSSTKTINSEVDAV